MRDRLNLNKNWTLDQALENINLVYEPGGFFSGQVRNSQIEAWVQLVGRSKANSEYNNLIDSCGSVSAVSKKYRISPPTLKLLKEFIESLPDDRRPGSVYAGLQLGQWRLVRSLGSGGNANVWRGKNSQKNDAAIKILMKNRGETQVRFLSEIALLKQLGNLPGILPLIDSIPIDSISEAEFAWYALPIAKSLKPLLPTLFPKDIIFGIMQIAETMTKLHELGVSHRDLKPDNMLVWKDQWVISDFGIASFADKASLTLPNQKLGPMHFLAPEMLISAGLADSKKADVYSLAKTLWVMLTGQIYPPPGEQRKDVDALKINSWINIDCGEDLDDIFEMATRYVPEARISMSMFTNKLRELFNNYFGDKNS